MDTSWNMGNSDYIFKENISPSGWSALEEVTQKGCEFPPLETFRTQLGTST